VRLSPLGTAATISLLYQPQMIDDDDCGEIGGMNIGRGKRSTRRKPTPTATLPTTNPTWSDPGLNPGRRGVKPATNRLSYGTASRSPYFTHQVIATLSLGNLYRISVMRKPNHMARNINRTLLIFFFSTVTHAWKHRFWVLSRAVNLPTSRSADIRSLWKLWRISYTILPADSKKGTEALLKGKKKTYNICNEPHRSLASTALFLYALMFSDSSN
jgi:hypothetical protein